MVADGLMTQGAIVLTWLFQNIPVFTLEGLSVPEYLQNEILQSLVPLDHRTTYQKRQFGVIQAIRSHAKN